MTEKNKFVPFPHPQSYQKALINPSDSQNSENIHRVTDIVLLRCRSLINLMPECVDFARFIFESLKDVRAVNKCKVSFKQLV